MSRGASSPIARRLTQTFLRTVRKHRLLEPGDRVLVAWSGGPDSTALLHLLLGIKDRWDLEIIAAHLHHGLRAAADRDVDFVRRAASRLEIPLFVGRADVQSRARLEGLSLEEAARLCRYEFLGALADEQGAAKIATGHTMSDQAETLLLRLLQGAGPRGLSGIHPRVEGRIIRPLLEATGGDLKEFLKDRRLGYVRDESNIDRRFLRNRIRLDLIPKLIKDFNPEAVRLLARTADILRQEDAFMEDAAAAEAGAAISPAGGTPRLRVGSLARLPRSLARRLVRRYLLELRGNLKSISFDDVEDILGLKEQGRKPLGKDLVLIRERGLVGPAGAANAPASFCYRWDGKRALKIRPAALSFRAKYLRSVQGRRLAFDDGRRVFLDAAKVRFPLVVRSPRPGDRYRPLGAPGSKKLKEILRARDIAPGGRAMLPVFLSAGKIVWIPGLPAAEDFKVGAGTRKVLLVEKD